MPPFFPFLIACDKGISFSLNNNNTPHWALVVNVYQLFSQNYLLYFTSLYILRNFYEVSLSYFLKGKIMIYKISSRSKPI